MTQFKRLYTGGKVASSGGKCFKKLSAKRPYVLNGTYVFNDQPVFPRSKTFNVTFTSGGVTYTSLRINYVSSSQQYLMYGDTKAYGLGASASPRGWAKSRSVTFDNVEVSEECYKWVNWNSINSNCTTTLNGTFLLKDTFCTALSTWEGGIFDFNFSDGDGESYVRMVVSSWVTYKKSGSSTVYIAFDGDSIWYKNRKKIKISNQKVSTIFAEHLIAHSTKQ